MTMRDAKRKRLESKGWKVGSTAEFLGLSADEAAYIELRLRLAAGLKRRRVEQSLTQSALAKIVRSSQSRVAKMETGDPTVSLDLLIRSLFALGASHKELAKLIDEKRRGSPQEFAVAERRSRITR
jgi:DNA-binding XRE family transcriptional regulator